MEETPVTKLLEKRRQILEVEKGLVEQKIMFNERHRVAQERRTEIDLKSKLLQDSHVKFDKYLKENDIKKNRAIQKLKEEVSHNEQKTQEIDQLKSQILSLELQNKQQEAQVANGAKYHGYLESVVEQMEDFLEIKDVISRHIALSSIDSELRIRQRKVQDNVESLKIRLQSLLDEYVTQKLHLNNALTSKKVKMEGLEAVTMEWQQTLDTNVDNASQKSLELGQIRMATNNLFTLVRSHLQNKVANSTTTIGQLDKIQQFIVDLSEITK